jgi:hypothetical protein
MKDLQVKSPKDEKITNQDDAVTNKDGDSYLEKREQPANQAGLDKEMVPAVSPDNVNGKPGPPAEDDSQKKDNDPNKENL